MEANFVTPEERPIASAEASVARVEEAGRAAKIDSPNILGLSVHTHGVWVSVCMCLQGLIDSMNDGGDLLRQVSTGSSVWVDALAD